MGTWYISSDESTWVTLAAAGIENGTLSFKANGVDEFNFEVAGDMLAAELFAYKAPIALKYDSTIRFRGEMNTIPRQALGSQESMSYQAVGGWWHLEGIAYTQQWQVMRTTDNTLIQAPKPRIIIGQNDAGERRTLSQEIEAVIDYLIAKGMPIAKGTIDAGPTAPYSEHTNFFCADVIRQCMRYMPDRICYFDHSTSPYPTFHCRQISSLTAATVDIVNVDAESLVMTPRYDIQVPGIRITYEQTHTVDGNDYESHTVDVEGDPDDARCVDLLFELAGSQSTYMRQKIEVADYPASPYTDKAFWKALFPWLDKVDDGDLTIDSVSRSGVEDYATYLVNGSIQEWMSSVDYEDETWTVKVSYVRRNDSGQALETVESKELKMTLRSTNGVTKEYRKIGSFTAAETIPTGVATALYNSWSHLHWQGNVVITEVEASFSMGPWRKLNLSNGLTAWATMGAAIQEVTIDIEKGTTRAKTGPSGVLEADALVGLFRACRARRFAWRATARTTALVGGSESEGAYSMPRERGSEADPGEFKQIRVAADAAAHEQLIQLDPSAVTFATSGDAAALTIAPREVFVPQRNGASPDELVYRLRQVLASEPYGSEQLVGALIRLKELLDVTISTPSAWDVIRWDSANSLWVNSPLPAVAFDLSSMRLGYSVSAGKITLRAGKLKMHGKPAISIAQSSPITLAGRQFFYVHHARGSTAAAWAVAGAEPGTSTDAIDVVFYEFLNGAIYETHRAGGDINYDLPIG